MNKKSNRIWNLCAALFLALWVLSSSSVVNISASDLPDTISYDDVIRQDMHNIASPARAAVPGGDLWTNPLQQHKASKPAYKL